MWMLLTVLFATVLAVIAVMLRTLFARKGSASRPRASTAGTDV
jgi:uncharacterized membrane protein